MKSASSTTPRNSNADHPPLARNAQGHPIAMPDGAVSWSIKRETRGRPKVIKGPDGHPYRLPLDATEEDILDNFGPGTYRLDALDALGNVLDYVTTVDVIGDDRDADDDDEDDTVGAGGESDLRFALQTIMQMAKAQSDSIRAVTEAQADWVKGLANAKSLPRNAAYAPPPLPAPVEDPEEEEDDDDDERDPDEAPAPTSTWMTDIARNVGIAVAPAVESFVSKLMKKASPAAKPPSPLPAAPTRNPMIHLAEINAGLTDDEREFLGVVLRSRGGEVMTSELLARSVDDAVALVRESLAEVRSQREKPRPTSDGFMSQVLAVAARLEETERATVLALLPRLPPERIEQLKTQLLAMTINEAAAWIRDNLPALEKEVGP